jgi:NAD(P)H-hydrate epimerase
MDWPDAPRPLPTVTRTQMQEIDRIMVDELGIELLQMMENAGANLARLARERFTPSHVLVAAGTGGNGGGGLVAARHLHNAGIAVSVVTTRPADAYRGVPAHQLAILDRMGLPLLDSVPIAGSHAAPIDLIIDAVIGYALEGQASGRAAQLIDALDEIGAPILSLDAPSGVDVSTGHALGAHIRATATLTLALPKTGLVGSPAVGEHYLADISVPADLYAEIGAVAGAAVAPIFRDGPILRVRAD